MAALPGHVERFIDEHIENLEGLEILLLLRSQPLREFEPREVTRELRLGSESASARLTEMTRRGLISVHGARYRYAGSGAIDLIIDELSRCYTERRVSVIDRIFTPRIAARRGPA
jgi:hypothetical protein